MTYNAIKDVMSTFIKHWTYMYMRGENPPSHFQSRASLNMVKLNRIQNNFDGQFQYMIKSKEAKNFLRENNYTLLLM